MKLKFFYFIIFIAIYVVIQCNNNKEIKALNYNFLVGEWAPCNNNNDAIIFEKNGKIIFVDNQKILDYKLKSDTLFILEQNYPLTNYIIKKLKKNTLVLQTEDGTVLKFVKGKNHPCGL